MTTISSVVVADSVSQESHRLTTVQMRYPRFVHAELMTHRKFSRNARSSRAVPIAKMIEECELDPVVPLHWGAAQAGMQAHRETSSQVSVLMSSGRTLSLSRVDAWLRARSYAVTVARAFMEAGYAKQVVNRLLEPFLHIDVLVSATEEGWANFLSLRLDAAAEPHIRLLAQSVQRAMSESTPVLLRPGQWHLPYVTPEDVAGVRGRGIEQAGEGLDLLRKLSVARCARISYRPFDGDDTTEAELRRYDLLVGSRPLHASPCEHQATPDKRTRDDEWCHPEQHRNFTGWRQYRALVEEAVG